MLHKAMNNAPGYMCRKHNVELEGQKTHDGHFVVTCPKCGHIVYKERDNYD